MDIKRVGVVGCGVMGSGIAQTIAAARFEATALGTKQRFLDRGFAGIKKSLDRVASGSSPHV